MLNGSTSVEACYKAAEYAEELGADAYAGNAVAAVSYANALFRKK